MTTVSGAAPPALVLDEVTAGYDERQVLAGGQAELRRGQAAALLGPNGSGKSTLLKVVLGLLKPWSGRVEVFGQTPDHLDRRRRQIGYVPQIREVDRSFPATVLDLAMMGRIGRLGVFHRPVKRDRELVCDVLEQVGLTELADRSFGALSGGQQQRVFLARALVQEPDLLVLDEPVAGVDSESRERIGKLLSELRDGGKPMLIATHDLEELQPFDFDLHWSIIQGRLEVDRPDESHSPHAADQHETSEKLERPTRPSSRFGLRPRISGWG
jgi:ABC-type Mn2+/Zn2+ transport system ATPase subunit